ncbi:MAG: hypothetical protein AAB582_02400 [Patescibacteria group bacterium]
MKGLFVAPVLFVGVFGLALAVHARTPAEDGPTMCTMQYQPVCGAKQVQCVSAPCYPQYHTYGNSCMMGVDGGSFIHEGECTASETGPVTGKPYVPPAHCTSWFDGCNQCGRGDNGESYCTLKACVGDPAPGYCTAYDEPPKETPPKLVPPIDSSTTSPQEENDSATATSSVQTEGFFAKIGEFFSGIFEKLSNLFTR